MPCGPTSARGIPRFLGDFSLPRRVVHRLVRFVHRSDPRIHRRASWWGSHPPGHRMPVRPSRPRPSVAGLARSRLADATRSCFARCCSLENRRRALVGMSYKGPSVIGPVMLPIDSSSTPAPAPASPGCCGGLPRRVDPRLRAAPLSPEGVRGRSSMPLRTLGARDRDDILSVQQRHRVSSTDAVPFVHRDRRLPTGSPTG